jgi:hypothetical protein
VPRDWRPIIGWGQMKDRHGRVSSLARNLTWIWVQKVVAINPLKGLPQVLEGKGKRTCGNPIAGCIGWQVISYETKFLSM